MKKEKIIRILTCFYLVPFLAAVFFNTWNSLLRTGYFETGQYVEVVKYRWNYFPITLVLTGIFLVLVIVSTRREAVSGKTVRKLSMVWAGAVSLCSILLFRTVAKCDSEFLSEAAIQLLQGNYSAFQAGEYLYMYPFQLGYTAFMELIYRLFGIENYIVFQLINICCIIRIIILLGDITWELFENETVCKIEGYLSLGLFPLFLLSTFIYGDILGWCLGMQAVFYIICYLKSENRWDILKASLWLTFGVLVKNNINILVVAAVIMLLLYALMKKKICFLLWALELIIVSQLAITIVNGIYSLRMGESIPEGIPKIAWVAMGVQEPYEDGSASGWYNGYNWTVYVENAYDSEKTSQECAENLKQSVGRFLESPRAALRFFYDKFTSQWNEPTFMSLLTNEWYSRNEEPQSAIAVFLLYGTGKDILYEVMKAYHFLIFLLTTAGVAAVIKKWKPEQAYFILNIFGGMLFHMIWEAKTRYVLGYFVLMVPIAAYGFRELIRIAQNLYMERRTACIKTEAIKNRTSE